MGGKAGIAAQALIEASEDGLGSRQVCHQLVQGEEAEPVASNEKFSSPQQWNYMSTFSAELNQCLTESLPGLNDPSRQQPQLTPVRF